jgi:hypothetical protein
MATLMVPAVARIAFLHNVSLAAKILYKTEWNLNLNRIFTDADIYQLPFGLYTFNTDKYTYLLYQTSDKKPFIIMLSRDYSNMTIVSNIYNIGDDLVLRLLNESYTILLTYLNKGSVHFRRLLVLMANEL